MTKFLIISICLFSFNAFAKKPKIKKQPSDYLKMEIDKNNKVVLKSPLNSKLGSFLLINSFNDPALKESFNKYSNIITNVSTNVEIDPNLIASIIWTESNFKSLTVKNGKIKRTMSHKGAVGLMQVLPKTRKEVFKKMGSQFNQIFTQNLSSGLNEHEIEDIIIGTYYIKGLLNQFANSEYAIIAYNEGPSRIMNKINKNIIFGTNHDYLSKVKNRLRMIASL